MEEVVHTYPQEAVTCRLRRISTDNIEPLSTRQAEVLCWICHGKSNWEIGAILGISENTVRFHVRSIIDKLCAANKTHAAAIAVQQGLIRLE